MKNEVKIKHWVLTPHCAKRLEERHITIAEVEEVITSPDIVKTQGPKYILAKHLLARNDNLIACVVLQKKEHNLGL